MTPQDELNHLIGTQHGLVSATQLRRLGYPRSRIRYRLEKNRWRAVLRGVYQVGIAPLTEDAVLTAALLFGGGHAMLSHETAAAQWGLVRPSPGPVHITVPYGKSSIDPTIGSQPASSVEPVFLGDSAVHPGVVVHRSRAHRHIGVDRTFPCTAVSDTAIDVAVGQSTAREAYRSLIVTVTNGRIRLLDVRRRLSERPPRRYKRALEGAVRLLADGVQSALEYEYATRVELAHGFPTARRQGPVVVDGRTLYEDCDYSACGVPLIVRLDGRATHSMAEVAFRDRRRDNAAELEDRPRLVYGHEEVALDACGVAAEVEKVLVREGWTRELPNPCSCAARA